MSENTIKIFTDGACKGNPGIGGWGALIIENSLETEIFGGSLNTTNNQMELKATIKALDQLISDVGTDINSDAKFVVFHDAYQYFEERFGVRAAGALTLNTDVLPGAKQIADIQDVIKDKGIKCIFSEPQFNPKIITTIAEDMNIKTGVFDPLGANIDPGKSLYFKLISNLGNELKGC